MSKVGHCGSTWNAPMTEGRNTNNGLWKEASKLVSPLKNEDHFIHIYSLLKKILKSTLFFGRSRLSDSRMQENAIGALREWDRQRFQESSLLSHQLPALEKAAHNEQTARTLSRMLIKPSQLESPPHPCMCPKLWGKWGGQHLHHAAEKKIHHAIKSTMGKAKVNSKVINLCMSAGYQACPDEQWWMIQTLWRSSEAIFFKSNNNQASLYFRPTRLTSASLNIGRILQPNSHTALFRTGQSYLACSPHGLLAQKMRSGLA